MWFKKKNTRTDNNAGKTWKGDRSRVGRANERGEGGQGTFVILST